MLSIVSVETDIPLKDLLQEVVELQKETKRVYGDAIVRLIAAASQLLDVEKIRVGSKISNWQTALKHCLELLYEGKIQGTKTSKSWVFWANSSRAFPKVGLGMRISRKSLDKRTLGKADQQGGLKEGSRWS
jgi:hypothetical protein